MSTAGNTPRRPAWLGPGDEWVPGAGPAGTADEGQDAWSIDDTVCDDLPDEDGAEPVDEWARERDDDENAEATYTVDECGRVLRNGAVMPKGFRIPHPPPPRNADGSHTTKPDTEAFARMLVGLPVPEARARAADDARFNVGFYSPDQPFLPVWEPFRIKAFVDGSGRVIEVEAG